ncbi:MAG: nuclear transport factor 2 family protein [Anaerolineaceae bacterium]|nr:nuclear transport factor 2 family protein [Anaerolineaceae bacterium]
MTLQGKGFMIWQIARCEGGNAEAIANAAQAAGLTHILIKIADGPLPYNKDKTTGRDLVPPVVQSLRNRGIRVWGWHYIYGANPTGEAQIAIHRVQELGMEGYIIDAEVEFKQPGMDAAARRFMNDLRSGLPNLPIALSSFRFPTYHPQFPWKDFLDKCDYNMPQVYWQAAHNAGAQLQRSVREFQAITPYRPVIPTGPVYKAGDWAPAPADVVEFMDTARALNLPSANYFEWYYGRTSLRPVWDAIAAYSWPASPATPDLPHRYITALNSHDPATVAALYAPRGIHITAAQTVQGHDAIRTWFTNFFNQTLPNAIFTLTSSSGVGNSRHFTWEVRSPAGTIRNGNDTIGILDGKIAYHYSYFTITAA